MNHDQPLTYNQAIKTLRLGNASDLEIADAVEAEVGRLQKDAEMSDEMDGLDYYDKWVESRMQNERLRAHLSSVLEEMRYTNRRQSTVAMAAEKALAATEDKNDS